MSLKKDDAIKFANEHGLQDAVAGILDTRIHPDVHGRRVAVEKGHFVELFEHEGLLNEFGGAVLARPEHS
jgi:hypothetical protein